MSTTICHRGLVREQNEDSCISNEQAQLWLVADGVGGNQGGKVASEMAVQTTDRRYRQGLSLKEAVLEANRVIAEASQQQEQLRGMATTIVAAGFSGTHYQLAWLGDSRAYLLGPDRIRQLSVDHNVASDLFLRGEIPEHELFGHPGQHELTQALGQFTLEEVPDLTGTLRADQCLLLCTDGLSGVLPDERIFHSYCKNVPQNPVDLKCLADDLLAQVLAAGAPDNICFSLIMLKPDAGQSLKKGRSLETIDAEGTETVMAQQSDSAARRRPKLNKAPVTWLVLSIVGLIMLSLLFIE